MVVVWQQGQDNERVAAVGRTPSGSRSLLLPSSSSKQESGNMLQLLGSLCEYPIYLGVACH